MRKLLTLFILSWFFACNNGDLDLKSAIDSNIKIELRELLSPSKRELYLYAVTEKIYPCMNYPLSFDQHFEKNRVSIAFTEVIEVNFCLTALGPATASINLGHLRDGVYDFELNNGALKNIGKLIITDTEATLEFITQNGIEIIRETTLRVPEANYWGTIGYHSEESVEKVNEFLAQLKSIVGVEAVKQVPGDYFFYQIDQHGEIVTRTENSGYYFTRAFIFQVKGEEEKAMEEIISIATAYFDEMYINIETYKGERFNNWSKAHEN